MKQLLASIHAYLLRQRSSRLVLLFLIGSLSASIFFGFLARKAGMESLASGFKSFRSIGEEILLGIFLAPILESLIFQLMIIEATRKKLPTYGCCLLSALAFGSVHYYNIFYFMLAFFTGMLFAYLYLLGGSIRKGFFLIVVTHMLHNSVALLMGHLGD